VRSEFFKKREGYAQNRHTAIGVINTYYNLYFKLRRLEISLMMTKS